MVRGAAVFAVALPAGSASAGHAIFDSWSGGRRGDAGDFPLNEHGVPGNFAGSFAGSYSAYFADEARFRNPRLRITGGETCCNSRSTLRHSRDLSNGAFVVRRRGAWR